MGDLGRNRRAPGLVRKAMREDRAFTEDAYGPTWDNDTPDELERRLARIAELQEQIADLPAREHKADLVAELRKLRREARI